MSAHLRVLHESESGIALVFLLVIVLFVALVGIAMADNVVRETQIAANESTAVQARYLAEAGIADAAAHLSRDNTWQGPITQTLGAGTYTVQVDPNVSQLGALGTVKSVLSTGTVFYSSSTPSSPGGLSAASQTVRVTLLVLPQAFSKALVSNTVATVVAATFGGGGPAIDIATCTSGSVIGPVRGPLPSTIARDTVLRQLGTIHANNVCNESPAASIVGPGTTVIAKVTASRGPVNVDPSSVCTACEPATNQPTIPFPMFDWNHYITLAQNNPNYPGPTHSPCPAVNSTGTFFAAKGPFLDCVKALTPDAQGFRALSGIIFVQDIRLDLPADPVEQNLKVNGTFVIYTTAGLLPDGVTPCSASQPCGDLRLRIPCGALPCNNLIFTAQNGEPAIMVGGSIIAPGIQSPGIIAITGLVYLLANTTDPTVNLPTDPGYFVPGTLQPPNAPSPVTITGMLVGQRVNFFNSDSLVYDPASFFPGLPSGLCVNQTPTSCANQNAPSLAPFALLPLSWSSGK